jgi:SNF2 family DNA or RNA helicase/uncharacterized Zn finger protein
MTKYGQTWWGERWLDALANIDFSNRLPRGKTYANNGSVQKILIEGNQITAKVRGSRPKPYDINIVVPPFDLKDEQKLIEKIIANPILISKLLNRELDPQILTMAQSLGIKVFPSSWNDLKMSCSCPDWAVPCKHLASVIYKTCSEIDNNPFLVFNLHRLDLVKALQEKNISIEDHVQVRLPSLTELLGVPSTSNPRPKSAVKKPGKEGQNATITVDINYSLIANILEPLCHILQDNPPFYVHGNFRAEYEKILQHISKEASRFFSGKSELPGTPIKKYQQNDAKTNENLIGFQDAIRIMISPDGAHNIMVGDKGMTLLQLSRALHVLIPAQLPDYHDSVAMLYEMQLFALNLIEKGAILPKIYLSGENEYLVRWLPALIDKNVQDIVHHLEDKFTNSPQFYHLRRKWVLCEKSVVSLCSLFLGNFIEGWSGSMAENKVTDLFFYAIPQTFDEAGEKEIPAGIAAWLSRLAISNKEFVPALKIELEGEALFGLNLQVENRKTAGALPISIESILADQKFEKNRYPILQNITLLSNFINGLDDYIGRGAKGNIIFTSKEFGHFLFDTLPALKLLDIKTILPKELQHIYKPEPGLRLKAKSKDSKGSIRLDDLLSFDRMIALGDELVEEDEFQKLVMKSHGIVKFRNRYIYLDTKDLERLQKALIQPPKLSPIELLRITLSEEYLGVPVQMTGEVRKLIEEFTSVDAIPVPKKLKAVMRPYQLRGYSWMYRNTRIGFGSVIADDMGLGKTLQVIATLLKFKEEKLLKTEKALVIVPTSLLTNWSKEIERFAPALNSEIYHGGVRTLEQKKYDVLLTTYGVARSDSNKLKKMKWFVVVTDEAQNIKNNDTAQTKAAKAIPAKTYIAMSGTPVENRLSEFWSIMDFANRGLLGNQNYFRNEFGKPIEQHRDIEALDRFRKITEPFLLRRMKTDKTIIADLPDKLEQNQFCNLTKEQAALYQTTLEKAMADIEGISGNKEQMFHRQGLVLQMIMALKQICNHPAQFLKNKKFEPEASGKTLLLLDLLESMHQNHEKTLIFTQFTQMAEMLKGFIQEKFGYEPLYLHGSQNRNQRDDMVNRFQTMQNERIFILSLKAGGTGLNLTAAQNVIHYDLWWNPAVEAQATDRAYRIGQTKNVMVHRFITQGTFEERINEMIQSKKELAELSVKTGENWIGNLSSKELKEIFTLR